MRNFNDWKEINISFKYKQENEKMTSFLDIGNSTYQFRMVGNGGNRRRYFRKAYRNIIRKRYTNWKKIFM